MKIRRIFAAILSAIIIAALFVGCNHSEILTEPGPKDIIYKSTPFTPKGESFSYLSGVAFYDNTVYLSVSETEAADDSTVENSYLLKTDLSGEVMEKILLYSAAEGQAEFSFYSDISIVEDGTIYLVRVTVKNSDSEESVTKTEIVSISGETQTVLVDVSERLSETGADAISIYFSDLNENDKKSIPDDIDLNIADGDSKYEYYGYSNSAIYGYNEDVRMLIADLPASGVRLSRITKLFSVSETQFLIAGYKGDQVGIPKLYILTKVDPEDVPDKSIIKVAAVTEPRYVPDYIAEFTASHPQYQVELKVYAKGSSTSYNDALRAFNTDIIAGNVPDVILVGEQMPYGSYVSKGLFADLYPFIDKDPDISREDLLAPLLAALETDGKLYSIAPAFYVQTLIGKTSIFGEKQGQSITELETAAAEVDDAKLFGNMNREDFVDVFLTKMARRFIDEDKGVCNFDSSEFISLLRYAKTLPPPAPDAKPYEEWAWSADETGDYKNDRVLIENMEFFVFRWIVGVEKMDFGEPITFLGYPNSSGESGIKAGLRLESAIMSKAENPDGAWEFVKGLQSYGDSFIESLGYPPLWYFPSLLSELDIAAKNATIPAFQYDTFTGERIPRVAWYGTDLSHLPNNTEADNAKMYSLFDSIDGIYRENTAIIDIIKEETAVYFATEKFAEDTAAIIQDRATTYLEETRG